MKILYTAAIALSLSVPAWAETVTLTPADPQPDADAMSPGLAVSYAYGAGGRTLEEAAAKLRSAEPGDPLVGMSYLDTNEGDLILTATEAQKVAASINGFIKFEEAGTFDVEFFSNDGLQAKIGGQEVAFFDGVHGCESAGVTQVEVPEAGWYPFEATYFQRKGSACLLMDWSVSGEMEPAPDEAFAFVAQ